MHCEHFLHLKFRFLYSSLSWWRKMFFGGRVRHLCKFNYFLCNCAFIREDMRHNWISKRSLEKHISSGNQHELTKLETETKTKIKFHYIVSLHRKEWQSRKRIQRGKGGLKHWKMKNGSGFENYFQNKFCRFIARVTEVGWRIFSRTYIFSMHKKL